MITTDSAFTNYLERTVWGANNPVPARDVLTQLENDFMEKLGAYKSMRPQDGSYRYLYSVFGKQIVARIGFLLRKKEEGEDNSLTRTLLSSATRLREAMKSMDAKLYKSELKPAIERYHRERMRRLTMHDEKGGELAKTVTPQPTTDAQSPVETPKIISSTQGLAGYLGCGRTMAFSIIKSGVLKKDAIQYKVGQCWKFNREKLDKYLADNPEILGKIRCKR